jgi:hypothetical protein
MPSVTITMSPQHSVLAGTFTNAGWASAEVGWKR